MLGRSAIAVMDKLGGSDGRVILRHAFILRRRGYVSGALEAFRRASRYSKSRRLALIELCRTLLEIGEVADAEIVLGVINREWPDAWEINELRGRVEMAHTFFCRPRNTPNGRRRTRAHSWSRLLYTIRDLRIVVVIVVVVIVVAVTS